MTSFLAMETSVLATREAEILMTLIRIRMTMAPIMAKYPFSFFSKERIGIGHTPFRGIADGS
jgi:hypothetical protein